MAKFDPKHAVVPPTNFGDKNSAEQFLGCGKFRQCANLALIFGRQDSPSVSVYLPICKESRFERAGVAQGIPIPIVNTPVSPVTYMTVATWAPLVSCPEKCRGYRSRRWAKILAWLRSKRTQKATQTEAPTSGVFSNGWVQTFGGAFVLACVGLIIAVVIQKDVGATEIAVVTTGIPTLFTILIVSSRRPGDTESSRDKLNKFPERGDHLESTAMTRTNPDGSVTHESTVARQIDRRPQLWEVVANKFKSLVDKPVPIRGEWIYTFETKHYQWSVRHSSDTAVKLCIEICKEAGRLQLAEPSFRKKFPDIAAITDDGDRWLLAIYKVAKIGKVTAKLNSSSYGVVTTGEGGEINDLPGASQVLCQMALNGF